MGEHIIIQTPNLSDDYGNVCKRIFVIRLSKWNKINKDIEIIIEHVNQTDLYYFWGYDNIYAFIKKCRIMEDSPSEDVIRFAKKLQNKSILNEIKKEIKKYAKLFDQSEEVKTTLSAL